jgi:aspartate aminotransferase
VEHRQWSTRLGEGSDPVLGDHDRRCPAQGGSDAQRRRALLGAGSEIWSVPAAPVQQAAALAFAEPPPICQRIAASSALHAQVAAAVAGICANAGLLVAAPQAGFYVYPDFEPWREHLRDHHQVTTSAGLARLLLHRYGAATIPGSAFGEPSAALRLRLATALLYGDTPDQQEAGLAAPDPTTLPWIAAALTQLSQILTDLASPTTPRQLPGQARSQHWSR